MLKIFFGYEIIPLEKKKKLFFEFFKIGLNYFPFFI